MLGADVDALDALGKKLEEVAQQVDQAKQQVGTQLQAVEWKGQDADKFKQDWESTGTKNLQQVVELLRRTGEVVKKQAQDQRSASNA